MTDENKDVPNFPENPLDQFTNDQLVQEIRRRNDIVVIAFIQDRDSDTEIQRIFTKGSCICVMGLARYIEKREYDMSEEERMFEDAPDNGDEAEDAS